MASSSRLSPFKSKIIVITGGSSGLGLALAKALNRIDCTIVLLARTVAKLETAQQSLQANSANTIAIYPCDITNAENVTTVFSTIAEDIGTPDICFNNAGVMKEGYFEDLSLEDFHHIMNTNFFGMLNVIKAVTPYLKHSHGRLINIASAAGLLGVFGYSAYCSSKHAIVGLTKSLYFELEPQGVKVHLVCPSEFDSPLVEALEANRTPENNVHTLMIPKQSVEAIVNDTLTGISKGHFEIYTGIKMTLAVKGSQVFPAISRIVAKKEISKVYKGPK